MKIKARNSFVHGNAMVTTLVLCSILSMVVAYYLSLVEQQNKLSFRSQAWKSAISITEAGIEEGMAQVNQNTGALATDGWSQSGSVYTKTHTFPNGDSYTATITQSPTDWVHPYSVT